MPTTQRTRRSLTVGVVLAGAAALGTVPAYADGPSASPAPATPHRVAFCKHVPTIDRRLDRAIKRIQGKAGVKGSIANLQKRIDAQKAKGHAEIAQYLQDVLNTRQSLLPQLQQRQADLAKVKTWCAEQPKPAPKTSAPTTPAPTTPAPAAPAPSSTPAA